MQCTQNFRGTPRPEYTIADAHASHGHSGPREPLTTHRPARSTQTTEPGTTPNSADRRAGRSCTTRAAPPRRAPPGARATVHLRAEPADDADFASQTAARAPVRPSSPAAGRRPREPHHGRRYRWPLPASVMKTSLSLASRGGLPVCLAPLKKRSVMRRACRRGSSTVRAALSSPGSRPMSSGRSALGGWCGGRPVRSQRRA